MKNLFIPFLGAFLAISCQKKDVAPIEAADPDWVKLEIPTEWSAGEQAYSLVGDIDHTLLVSTIVGLYATSDQGKTWQKLRTTSQIVWALMSSNDTIFALNSYRTNSQGDKLAACFAEEFSTDFGRTWAYTDILGPNSYEKYRAFRYPLGQVSAAGYAYRTRENTVSVPNSTSRLVVASDLLRTNAASGQQVMRLPGRHYLNNLYLDARNRLYVAASGVGFDAETGTVVDFTRGSSTAVVYVSRRPLP